MKTAKLYAFIWIILAAAILSAYTTDSFSPLKLILFGFLGSALFFVGLATVFKHLMNKRYKSATPIVLIKTNRSTLPTETSNYERFIKRYDNRTSE